MAVIPIPKSPKSIAIAGATGAVGLEFLKIFEKSDFPIKSIKLLASKRSAGMTLNFKGENIRVEEMTHDSFQGVDIALFSCGSSITKTFAESVKNAGAVLIDNSSAYRMTEGVPLVVPEINPEAARQHNGLIANPNCSTIIMLMAVFPIYRIAPIEKIVVSTYQAVSGAGWQAMEELKKATLAYLNGENFQPSVFPYNAAFNLFSHNSKMNSDNGYNEEEIKMVKETHKILGDSSLKISPTCVRVPVLRAHSESIHLQFKNTAPSLDSVKDVLSKFEGVRLVDDREKNYFPMPVEASEQYDCLVGRIRHDYSQPDKALELFVAGDQLLKGAALNAVQIAGLL